MSFAKNRFDIGMNYMPKEIETLESGIKISKGNNTIIIPWSDIKGIEATSLRPAKFGNPLNSLNPSLYKKTWVVTFILSVNGKKPVECTFAYTEDLIDNVKLTESINSHIK